MNAKVSKPLKAVKQKLPDTTIAPPALSSNRWWLIGLLLSIVIVYGRTIGYGFSPMDDTWLIADKMDFLRDIRNLPVLFTQSTLKLFYRPVLHISFMIDAVISQSWPSIFHATNIALHIFSVVALFRFFRLLGIERTWAIALCFLFALHPVNVQAVAWIPGRNDSLLALFTLLSCNGLLRFLKTRNPLWIFMHALFFAAALFTKETALVLPIIYFALVWVYGKEWKNAFKITTGIFWVFAAAISWWLHIQIVGGNHTMQNASGTVLTEFFRALVMQTGKLLLPVQQSIYPLSQNISLIPFVAPLLLVLVLSWKYGFRNKQIAALGLIWLGIFIAIPTWYSAAATEPVHYEHRNYLVLPGLLLLLSQINIPLKEPVLQKVLMAVAVIFALLTFRREEVYSSYDRYMETALDEAPQVSVFYDLSGFTQHQKGNYQVAINNFTEAIALDSTHPAYYNHRGNSYLQLRQYRNAIGDYDKVLSRVPSQAQTYYNRSLAYYGVGDYQKANIDLFKADSLGAGINPDYVNALTKALRQSELQSFFGQ